MINPKKLIKLARKWQKMAALKRKRITLTRIRDDEDATSEASSTPSKGHFVVYTMDQRRFVFPIRYLNKYIFIELLRMSEEEFGLPSDGPITLPCDAATVKYVMSMLQRSLDKDMEKALFTSVVTNKCSSTTSLGQEQHNHQSLICSF